jgi:endonuclease-3
MHRERACRILRILFDLYYTPGGRLNFIDFDNSFQVLVLTILSARTTDAIVNGLKDELFSRYPTPEALAAANQEDVEDIIRPAGFFRAKARNIIGAAGMIVSRFSGRVPESMEELVRLPGVGRKTANIVLEHAFGISEGIAVDTHVARLSYRTGMTESRDPGRIERDLMDLIPEKHWRLINFLFISHGRAVCLSRKPRCEECAISWECRYYQDMKAGNSCE